MGATTTLRLALRQPDRFSVLALIDPVLFPPWIVLFWDMVYRLGLAERIHPLVKAARRRRRLFESREAMFASYRRKPVFAGMGDSELQAYIASATRSVPGHGVQLVYPPEWEARIYATGIRADRDLWRGLSRLKPPLLIIRGGNTTTFWESTGRLIQRKLHTAKIISIPGAAHLVPLEKPGEVAHELQNFLHANGFE